MKHIFPPSPEGSDVTGMDDASEVTCTIALVSEFTSIVTAIQLEGPGIFDSNVTYNIYMIND